MARFRPNLVVRGSPAFAEDTWQTLQVDDSSAKPLTLRAFKPCNRCGVVNVDTVRVHETVSQSSDSIACEWQLVLRWFYGVSGRCAVQGTAERHREPFLTLAKYRRAQGKVLFGSLYSIAGNPQETSTTQHRYTIDVGVKLLGS